jgi:hypothetical protein
LFFGLLISCGNSSPPNRTVGKTNILGTVNRACAPSVADNVLKVAHDGCG